MSFVSGKIGAWLRAFQILDTDRKHDAIYRRAAHGNAFTERYVNKYVLALAFNKFRMNSITAMSVRRNETLIIV